VILPCISDVIFNGEKHKNNGFQPFFKNYIADILMNVTARHCELVDLLFFFAFLKNIPKNVSLDPIL